VNEGLTQEQGRPRKYLAVLRRRLWIIITCVILGGAVAYLAARHQEKQYSATASLLFQNSEFGQALYGFAAQTQVQDPQITQATNVGLVSEGVVAANTAASLRLPAAYVSSSVSVAAAGASNIVNVTATSASPRLAARVANAYANTFIAYAAQSQRAQFRTAAASLNREIAAQPAGSSQLRPLRTRLAQLEALESLQTGNVQTAGSAGVPTSPSSPSVTKDTVLGLVIGLLVGIVALLVAERIDSRVRDQEEASRLVHLPILGRIPASRTLASTMDGSPLAASGFAGAFQILRTQLRYFNIDRDLRSVLLTSAGTGDGKSTVAWNLARTAAALSPDAAVLLVDADLRRPRVAVLSGEDPSPGLAELLTRDLHPDTAIRTVRIPQPNESAAQLLNVYVLPAGIPPPNPAELLESHKMRELLADLEARFDLVIIDAPPTSVVSDAIPLMARVSGVLVVVRLRHTSRNLAAALRTQLHELGAPCLGLVVNGTTSAEHDYSAYNQYAAANGGGAQSPSSVGLVETTAGARSRGWRRRRV
jgi:polysaccharide biosynthesis transport protein